jgi:hypothetical protein
VQEVEAAEVVLGRKHQFVAYKANSLPTHKCRARYLVYAWVKRHAKVVVSVAQRGYKVSLADNHK